MTDADVPSPTTDSPIAGVDVDRVSAWLTNNVATAEAPFVFEPITGGHSNLTITVTGNDGSRFVLRRPPLGHVLASAHDMEREHRIVSGLRNSAVPVPPIAGLCTDLSVNGTPFYVMEFVDGHVLRDAAASSTALDESARANASRSLVDTMAKIHDVDLEVAGLHQLGRHEGYIARQLRRWYGQWDQGKTRDLAIGVTKDAILLIDDKSSQTVESFEYARIQSWAASKEVFSLKLIGTKGGEML